MRPKIFDHITDSTLERTQCLTESYWREGLIKGRLLPFLWDLDVDSCQGDEIFEMDRDYKLLVHQLSQLEFWAESGKNVPPGLRNRHRIWRLVEEMYVGDITSSDIS